MPQTMLSALPTLLENLPQDWVELTTHRLDIYDESAAKTQFLDQLKNLLNSDQINTAALNSLPTAYDYIRLGHQLSSVLEWVLAEINQVSEQQVIAFASKTMPILALLRHNLLQQQVTYIYYDGESPLIDESRLKNIYGYQYHLTPVQHASEIPLHGDGQVVFITSKPLAENLSTNNNIDVTINLNATLGAYVVIHSADSAQLSSAVQHVRRRETIAASPQKSLAALQQLTATNAPQPGLKVAAKTTVNTCIQNNTGSAENALVASSGLSIQYAILMGLVENAMKAHPDKPIRIVLPPNCYGGTNDQSRRVAELIPQVDILDLLVDGGADLVTSLEEILATVAELDGVPIVLAEIPTNPRVEVPDMQLLAQTLHKNRVTPKGETAVKPTFMVDQTFCPNVKLLHAQSELRAVKTISFSSGSKFPSGGRCIAGYCAANQAAADLLPLIEAHLILSDNAADQNQLNILAATMPSMPERIIEAYHNTRKLVDAISGLLPNAKIYYVDEHMAQRGFMPSVFSLDLPVKATSLTERHELQKQLNMKLIEFMITKHPKHCKNCVSYGQLKGSYWTIPATSTQGTTKEKDKDYVVRASISPEVDVDMLIQSFTEFCDQHNLL